MLIFILAWSHAA